MFLASDKRGGGICLLCILTIYNYAIATVRKKYLHVNQEM